MIGKENIEEKIFEYFEGDLSASEAKDLESFIEANPEYQGDFDAWKKSSVESDPVEFKHMNDLLVEEKSSPKGWFKWASGGAFMLLLSFASFGIFTKMNSTDATTVAVLNEDVNPKEAKEILNSKEVITSNSSRGVNATSDIIEAENNIVTGSSSTSSSATSDLNNSSLNGSDVNVQSNQIGNKKVTELSLPSTKKSSGEVLNELFNKIGLEYAGNEACLADAELAGIYSEVFEYENPNKKKKNIVLLNLKDPYLNYNLGHTLEENASFAGNSDGIRAEFLYRTEWPNVTNESYESQIGSIDWYSKALKGGVGVMFNRDMIGHGKLGSLSASLLYSPKFILGGVSVEPSVKYTFNQKSINWDQVKANDIKDPRNGVVYASIPLLPENVKTSEFIYHDFGFGLLVNAKKFYAGFQYDHVNNPTYKEDFFDQTIKIPGKYSFQVGTDIKKNDKSDFTFSPSVNYVGYGNYKALWGNSQFSYKGFMAVAGAASNKDVMFSLGYANSTVRLVYGFGLSKPKYYSGLEMSDQYYDSHQISLRINLKPNKR